ncbi:hypothetical protein PM082_022075 [Marasmius tenuissimus]|nr:hypothetical protein PM082_022075 [Marasmius tenuissimus]
MWGKGIITSVSVSGCQCDFRANSREGRLCMPSNGKLQTEAKDLSSVQSRRSQSLGPACFSGTTLPDPTQLPLPGAKRPPADWPRPLLNETQGKTAFGMSPFAMRKGNLHLSFATVHVTYHSNGSDGYLSR